MTEQEAKKKWCPYQRILYSVRRGDDIAFASVNQGTDENMRQFITNCIGSECMMWRTVPRVEGAHGNKPEGDGWKDLPYPDHKSGALVDYCEREVLDSGYCGLAGKP